jgi:LTXXQ motif family protein
MSRISISRVGALVAALALPGVALAQTTAATSATSAPMMAAPMTAAPMAPAANPPATIPVAGTAAVPALPKALQTKVEAHITALHKELGITAAEEPQWTQFAQVMMDNAARMNQAFEARHAQVDTMTAVDNMNSFAQLSEVNATNTQALAGAFATLYQSFPAAQQKVADAVFRRADGKSPLRHH